MTRIFMTLIIAVALVIATPHPAAATFDVLRITVTDTATMIYTNQGNTSMRVLVRNPSAVSVYVGASDVLSSTGFEIAAGDAAAFVISGGDSIFGIVASGSQIIHRAVGLGR